MSYDESNRQMAVMDNTANHQSSNLHLSEIDLIVVLEHFNKIVLMVCVVLECLELHNLDWMTDGLLFCQSLPFVCLIHHMTIQG